MGKNKSNKYRLADVTDDSIYKAIKSAQGKAKVIVEELGMADLLVRHLLWSPDEKIHGIDGGKEHTNDDDNDDSSDESGDKDESNDDSNFTSEDQSQQKNIAQLQESCLEDEAMIANDLEIISKNNLLEKSNR